MAHLLLTFAKTNTEILKDCDIGEMLDLLWQCSNVAWLAHIEMVYPRES